MTHSSRITTANDELRKDITYELIREFITEFTQRNRSTRCNDLLGLRIETQEGFDRTDLRRWFEGAGFSDVRIARTGEQCCADSGCSDEKAQIHVFLASGSKLIGSSHVWPFFNRIRQRSACA